MKRFTRVNFMSLKVSGPPWQEVGHDKESAEGEGRRAGREKPGPAARSPTRPTTDCPRAAENRAMAEDVREHLTPLDLFR
jgi:hypothetical protein